MYCIIAFFLVQIGRIFPVAEPEVEYWSVYTIDNIYTVTGHRLMDELGNVDTTFNTMTDLHIFLEDITARESQIENTGGIQYLLKVGKLHVDVFDNTQYDWYDKRYDPAKNASIVYSDRDTTFEVGFTNEYENDYGVEHYYFMD